nr:MAG TPA: hypothetical protein [Caudoviricetes sp.]
MLNWIKSYKVIQCITFIYVRYRCARGCTK